MYWHFLESHRAAADDKGSYGYAMTIYRRRIRCTNEWQTRLTHVDAPKAPKHNQEEAGAVQLLVSVIFRVRINTAGDPGRRGDPCLKIKIDCARPAIELLQV